jgi:hypothetical protein
MAWAGRQGAGGPNLHPASAISMKTKALQIERKPNLDLRPVILYILNDLA